ncbi:MAG: type IV toxin-antitoxin system AbiEi family antitoxin domain-containing protein [Pseudonocardia sp.]|nr:type IV toxin-antitoxin system AbiEi family antitoxin domain-containing protein [Pseudonocardia sp.]
MQLHHLLARQAGVVTLAQAVGCGVSAGTVQRWTREGTWRRLHPSVYLAGGHRLTDEARIRAAWLWAGADAAVVTGPAAAFWQHMLPRAPALIDVTVPRHMHRRPRPGILLQRRDLDRADLIKDRDVLVADRPFAALETAVALPDGSTFLDRALQRYVRFPALYRSYTRNLGREGSSEAGRLITAAADRADSAAERLLVKLLREAGIGGWVLGHPFGPYRIDLAFPAKRVAVEVDGWAWHVDAERFRNDRRKGNAITRGRWDLLRFTWHGLDGQPAESIAEIIETLALSDAA